MTRRVDTGRQTYCRYCHWAWLRSGFRRQRDAQSKRP